MYRLRVACVGKDGKLEVVEFDAPKPSICYGRAKWQGKRIQCVVKKPLCYFCGEEFSKERYTHLYESDGEDMVRRQVLICPRCRAEQADEGYCRKEEKAESNDVCYGGKL